MNTNQKRLFRALVAGGALVVLQAPSASFAQPGDLPARPGTGPVGRANPVLIDDRERGFKPIFNGKDLTGWDGNPKLWSVKDGAIVGQTTVENPASGNTFLIWTKGTVSDFDFRCSFKITPGDDKGFANSGIQYRSKILDPANWVVGGYQADMEAGPTYTGILYEERMTRGIMAARGEKVVWNKDCKKEVVGSLGTSEELQAAIKKGDWNDYVIIAKGNHLQHFINGKQTVDIIDDCEAKRAMSGVLALQLHRGPPMLVQYRNLRIKTLGSDGAGTPSDDLKKFQGAWRVTSMEAGGTASPPEDVTNIVVVVKDRSYKVLNIDGRDGGTFSVDPSRQPKQMDIASESGATLLAIYEWLGTDGFRVCYGREGAPRPTSFTTTNDARHLMITYKHWKEASSE